MKLSIPGIFVSALSLLCLRDAESSVASSPGARPWELSSLVELALQTGDPCTEICVRSPELCGAEGSYCKGRGHACHDLYHLDERRLCSKRRDSACTGMPLVSCADGARYLVLTSRPASRSNFTAVGPVDTGSVYHTAGRRGYGNLGMTCYLASTLQMLSHSRGLRALVLNFNNTTVTDTDEARFAHEVAVRLQRAFAHQWLGLEADSSVPMNPVELLEVLQLVNPEFTAGRMQDAQEALRMLLGGLQDALRTSEGSPIDDLFSITIQNTRTCAACSAAREVEEQMHEVHLPIPQVTGRPVNLTECFAAFLETERVAGVACEGGACGPLDRPNAEMTHRFTRMPPVLLVSLNRFTWDGRKINTEVRIEPELDMSTIVGGGDARYRLVSIVNHLGSTPAVGHYTAYFMHPEDGTFYRANDDTVDPIDGYPPLTSSAAYIFMYERI